MKKVFIFCFFFLSLLCAQGFASSVNLKMEVGTFCSSAPYGITILVNRGAAFVVNPEVDIADSRYSARDEATLPYPTCAPDGSYFISKMSYGGNEFTLTWGRLNDHAVGAILTSEHTMTVPLHWRQPFSGCKTIYWVEGDELRGNGYATNAGVTTPIRVRSLPGFSELNANYQPETTTVCHIEASKPTIIVISIGDSPMPAFDEVAPALDAAGKAYASSRVRSEGDWGNFAGAIPKTLNASRMFSSLDRRVAHSIGRGWWIAHQHPINGNDDLAPYFAWDSFFNSNMASLEDPETARETVRAVLAMQNPQGMIGSFSHWAHNNEYLTAQRTNPPVAALCVWKLHQRRPDVAFLKEVYTGLVRWHDWFHVGRARPGEFLLSWGSPRGSLHDAILETGWDDSPTFGDGAMEGNLLNQYSVDLNSLWAMDAEHLAKIAEAIGLPEDAKRFRDEHARMIKEMNERLWNEKLGLYCSRSWKDNPDGSPHFITRITPMNFYPLICGAPDKKRAKRILNYLHDPKKFWGEYIMPTLPYDDPDFPNQGYWRGHIWGPASYLVWQGVLRYDDSKHISEYARRCVGLFMKNWETPAEICGENYRSDTGTVGDDPHYTWGALLPMIGIEALVEIGPDMKPVPRNLGLTESLTLRNIPFGGALYRIENRAGVVTITQE